MGDEKDTWSEWRIHILKTQEDHSTGLQKLAEDHQKLAVEMAVMKAKITLYAAMGGGAATIIMNFLMKKFGG